MSPRSSVRQNELIPEGGKNFPPPHTFIDFDGARLAEELLSLGNPKITRPIAQLIAQEVEKELREGEPPLITAEVISDLVRFKLEELGLIEIRSPRPRPKKFPTEKPMKSIHPFAVKNPSVRIEVKPYKPTPRKVDVNWSEEGRAALRELPRLKDGKSGTIEDVTRYLEEIAHWASEADRPDEALPDRESVAIHFYNPLAALDFLPGTPILRTDLATGRPAGLVQGTSFISTPNSIFSMLQKIEKEQNGSWGTTLGFAWEGLEDHERSEGFEAASRFLKHLKTSFEHRTQGPNAWPKQDLFFQIPSSENDFSRFVPLLEWIRKDENRLHFTLSLGVSGNLWDQVGEWKHSAMKPREASSTESVTPPTNGPSGLPALQEDRGPDTDELKRVVRLLRDQLRADSHLRLFFTNRTAEESKTPLVREDQVPSPVSPGLLYSGEWIPAAYLNLSAMVEEEEISWDRLRRATRQSVHFLDNVIDRVVYPSEEMERISKANRSLAVGVMGWADLLYLLRIPYNSDEAVELASRISQFIQEEAVAASSELAKTRGVFPNYIGSTWQKRGIPVRNAHLTGLVWDPHPSQVAQVALGIEPHGLLVAPSKGEEGKSKYLVHPFLAQVAKTRNFSQEAVFRKIAESGGLQGISEIPQDVQKVFVNAQEIDWEWHLRIAHAFEKNFDLGVAKLCPVKGKNLEKNLEEILQKGHDLRLRSLFFKRIGEADPTSPAQVQDSPIPHTQKEEEDDEVTQVAWLSTLENAPTMTSKNNSTLRQRPEKLTGSTYQFKTGLGHLFVTVNEDPQGPFEVFTQLKALPEGKKVSPESSELLQALSRMVSFSFQQGVDPREVMENLQDLGPSSGEETLSLIQALSKAISQHLTVKPLKPTQPVDPLLPDPTPSTSSVSPLPPSPPKEAPYSIFDEVSIAQDALPDFSEVIPPTAACVECGKPFKKLNGSDSCPECKIAY